LKNIYFFTEEIIFRLRHLKKIRQWVQHTIELEGGELESINFIFTSDSYLHKINMDYLHHDTFTDIITFDYNEPGLPILSDIYISIDRCKENSKLLKISIVNEVHRIIIHGVLHLLGYKDKNNSDKEQMTTKEDYYLSLRHKFGL